MPWPTALFDISFGTPDVFGAPGQRKIWFPTFVNVAQLPSAVAARERQEPGYVESVGPTAVIPPLPVDDNPWEYVYPEPPPVIREVLPRQVAVRPAEIPTEVVVVEGVSTEVERYETGDFPAGSIFAPGRAWGDWEGDFDASDEEETQVAFGDILDWGLDTLLGQQPWQAFGTGTGGVQPTMQFAAPNIPAPSGIPGQPTTISGYQGGAAVTNSGDCGNRRYVTLDRETGKISCKRRRRRRLLTNRDLADLASLKTITGGGAALNAAVIRAVR